MQIFVLVGSTQGRVLPPPSRYISGMAKAAVQNPVRSVHSMQPLPNYLGFLLCF